MIRLKTGVLFGASLKIGALIGGASTSDADLLYDFGVNIGLGFQLKDDLLDTFGNEIVFGKKNGGDIVSNKKTYLYIKALESAIDSDRNILLKHYKSSELQSDSKIKLIKDMFIKLKVDIAASEVIDGFFNLGIESLDKINLPSKRKIQLMEVAVKMIDRNK